jgi:tyrosyl-tRNA synthetase
MKNFVEELQWRGLIHDIMPGTEEQLNKEMTVGYVGFDPTADSLGVGNLVAIMLLKHLQVAGHKPIALVGGATGMVGDPSGKSEERNFLSEEQINHNLACQKKQLEKFLDFNSGENSAEIVNNHDWFSQFSLLGFLRDVGKHISVNYMMAKDSVKKRLETGISFTEFSYQLIQGYDFYHLNQKYGCKLQMGGSDQWGNITTGTEMIRKFNGGDAFAITAPLLTKSDGSKFGKSEGGNIWLDPKRTSPYKFYQFWINSSDEDALKFLKVFTLLSKEEIEKLEAEHNEAPHTRVLQRTLAEDITKRVHSEEALEAAIQASEILFGKATEEALRSLSEDDFLSVFEGVPQSNIPKETISKATDILEFISEHTSLFPSKGEARKGIKANAVAVNKSKVNDAKMIGPDDVLNNKYILLQKGKKNYHLVILD